MIGPSGALPPGPLSDSRAPIECALILILAGAAPLLAQVLRTPSILLLLALGFGAGAIGALDPDALLGNEVVSAIVSISVGVVLFDSGLDLRLGKLRGAVPRRRSWSGPGGTGSPPPRPFLIGILFIVPSARVSPQDIGDVGWASVAFVAILVLIARPLAVSLSALGSTLRVSERALIAWMGPRGHRRGGDLVHVRARTDPGGGRWRSGCGFSPPAMTPPPPRETN